MPNTILIVDDSPDIHALLKVRLRDEGRIDLDRATARVARGLPSSLAMSPYERVRPGGILRNKAHTCC